jgi:hypothetical protein
MSNHDEYLKQAHEDCQTTIKEAQAKASDAIEADVEQLRRHSLDNIPQKFGDFLYTALGDRITGQRSSVMNTTYIENNSNVVALGKRAEANGISLEKFVRQEQADYIPNNWSSHFQPQLWITAGRKFGVSYVTGENGQRSHTIYFGAGSCFAHLTQEHVDCVKNKLKRACAQSFLDFRDEFLDGIEDLSDKVIPVSVPVKLGVVSCITKSPMINANAHGYSDRAKKTFTVMDNVVDDEITDVIANVNTIEVWDKVTDLSSGSVGSEKVDIPTYVSLTFLKINDTNKTHTIIGNVDIGMDDVATSSQNMDSFANRGVLNRLDCITEHHRFQHSQSMYKAGYADYSPRDSNGIVLNMDEVLQNPTVKAELDKRIKFYNDMSDKLQKMKHDHATLYFVNADL